MEDIGAARRRAIEQRLRAGEKAVYIAREKGLSPRRVARIAGEAGIALKRGRPKICDKPEIYRRHIDAVFGPGMAEKLMRLRRRLTYADIGREFLGGKSRGSAHHIDRHLTGGSPKPAVPRKPWPQQRTDITVEKVRRLAGQCLSVGAIARSLNAHSGTIYSRAKEGGIKLPNGLLHMELVVPDKRPDITREKLSRIAKKSPSLTAVARALKTGGATIKRRAKRWEIPLPNMHASQLARRARLCARILKLAKARYGVPLIAAKLKIPRSAVYRNNRKFCLGVPIAPRQSHGARLL